MELKLITDDVMAGLDTIPAESVDLIFTSPDYNLGVAYKNHQQVQETNDYLDWAFEWASDLKRVLKPEGSFFLNIAGAATRPLLPFQVLLRFTEIFVLQNTFHWIKSISLQKGGKDISLGHFKPINSPRYVNDMHEYVFHFSHKGKAPLQRKTIGVPYEDQSNIERWGHTDGSNKRCRGNTWTFTDVEQCIFAPYETIQSRDKQRPHVATFPVALADRVCRLAGAGPDTVVLDPFVGLGSCGVAAASVPVKQFIGIDREPYYTDFSAERIRQLPNVT